MNRVKFVIICEDASDDDVLSNGAVRMDADGHSHAEEVRVEDCGMKDYLAVHGWHFSKKLCDYAVSQMKGRSFAPVAKEHVDIILRQNGVVLAGSVGYDATYVYNMAKSDFFGSSIPNEQFLTLFVRDYIDDADGYEGLPLRRFVADCEGKGIELDWGGFV